MSITITEVRNARSLNADKTSYDVEINHPEYGWIPYTITHDDPDTTINNDELLELIGSNYVAFVPRTQEQITASLERTIRWDRDQLLIYEVDPLVSTHFAGLT
jgi:hypothetical protein